MNVFDFKYPSKFDMPLNKQKKLNQTKPKVFLSLSFKNYYDACTQPKFFKMTNHSNDLIMGNILKNLEIKEISIPVYNWMIILRDDICSSPQQDEVWKKLSIIIVKY